MVRLITFSCYGSHLPGDERGSFDHIRLGGNKWVKPSAALVVFHRKEMRADPYTLANPNERKTVSDAIQEFCRYRRWTLFALHIRTTHVHGVVDADASRAHILNSWKSYATRALRRLSDEPADRIYWSNGGSDRQLRTPAGRDRAIHYVRCQQGEPMETYSFRPRFDEQPRR